MKYLSIYRKLFKFQKKIQETERKNPRLCRNLQRRLYRSSSIQLLIINEILQLQLKRSRKKKEIFSFHKMNEMDPSPIIFSKLISKEYRYYLTRQIFNILWVFALSPILDNKKKDQIILTGLKGSQIYSTIYTFFKKPLIQYITISQFSNFFNRKNKYWILSNLLIEKKFFLNWLKLDQRSKILDTNSLLFSLSFKNTSDEFILQNTNDLLVPKKKLNALSLKTTLENFVNLSFSDFLDRYVPTIAQSRYYFSKYQNGQTLIPPIPSDFMDTSRSIDASFRDTNRASRIQSRLVNYLKLFVQKFCQRIFLIDVIFLPNVFVPRNKRSDARSSPQVASLRDTRREEGRHIDGASRRSRNRMGPISKKFQIGCPFYPDGSTKTRLKIKPLLRNGDATKCFAMFHAFNNMDLKNGLGNTVNGIASISQQFRVCKNILPSRGSTSKFRYFDLMQKYWLKPIPTKLALAFSPQFPPKLQPSIRFFYKHMEYNGLILLALKKKGDFRFSHNRLVDYAQTHGLKIKFIKFYSLDQGLHFLGWFFHKKNHSFEGFISPQNIYNHQKELKYCLKTSKNKPMDKIIYELNQKIHRWQKFYNCSLPFSKTCSQLDRKSKLNDDLFWLIWRWIKKRHINRGSQWLYNRYWKKSTSRRWIFFAHQHTLIFYI